MDNDPVKDSSIIDNDNHSHSLLDQVHDDGITSDQVSIDSDMILTSDQVTNEIVDSERKAGRPPHLPTADTRSRVFMLSTVGTRYEDIATVLGISHDTLTRHYKEDLDKGRIEANASVAETLFKQAKEGNTTAMIFWLKSRARWAESHKHEISGNEDGTPIQVKVVTGIE